MFLKKSALLNKCIKMMLCFIAIYICLYPGMIFAAEENYYTISTEKHEEYDNLIDVAKKYDAAITYEVKELGIIQVKASKDVIEKIGKDPLVGTYNVSLRTTSLNDLEKGKSIKPEDAELWNVQWDMKKVTNNGESYKLFSGTKNVTVGIIDSGLDIKHPDLQRSIVSGSKNLVPSGGFRGKETEETGDENQLTDNLGHGTHVAGQVAADGKIKGVAPGIGIKSYRVIGERTGEAIWIIKAIIEAAKDGVDVINISLGNYLIDGSAFLGNQETRTDKVEINAFKEALKFAEKQGSVVVAAAGNDSLNVNDHQQMYKFLKKKLRQDELTLKGRLIDVPASLSGVVTVASVGPTNELSTFSNYGDNYIDIAAPGGDNKLLIQYGITYWLDHQLEKKEKVLSTGPDQEYFYDAGNSVATPKVSGTLALIIDKQKLKKQPNRTVQFLYENGIDKTIDNDKRLSCGILNTYKAMAK
ncbi:S8 family peptidase [Bacillus sp. FSL K6-0067]|uniref:S8 family peptidase n=1 Tax=Bacillus sp. FSL K6-0067 TaxID=2921412 RepID=UPI00077A2814|nr:S8 family serine peptidase [Bacillus cereus]KXY33441.1 peptidase S8 [Bacillus cereus]